MTFQNTQHHATNIDTHDLQTILNSESPHAFNIAASPAQQEIPAQYQTQHVAPTTSIADQLLGAFPLGTYCLPALLSLAEIVETTSVATAAVECTLRPRFLINPEWVAQHAQTPEKLVMLTMHELHHVVLGHTRLFARATPLDNLVFDAVINSMLCQLFPERPYQALLTDIYSENKFPECFLRPTNVWTNGVRITVPPVLLQPEHKHLAPLYERLYTPQGATYEELREAFRGAISDEQFVKVQLLGDHSDENPSSDQAPNDVAYAAAGKGSGKIGDIFCSMGKTGDKHTLEQYAAHRRQVHGQNRPQPDLKDYRPENILRFYESFSKAPEVSPIQRFYLYSLGWSTIEALAAIGGIDSPMNLFVETSKGLTFKQAFKKIYGIEWEAAAPILAEVVSKQFRVYYP